MEEAFTSFAKWMGCFVLYRCSSSTGVTRNMIRNPIALFLVKMALCMDALGDTKCTFLHPRGENTIRKKKNPPLSLILRLVCLEANLFY